MLKAKRKRLREEQESMDRRVVGPVRTHPSSPMLALRSQGMRCSSQSPHPAKRACVDLAAGKNDRVLKEEDPVDISPHVPAEVSKLDPPAVKRPPARFVEFGAAADLMINDTGGFDQEDQDVKEEVIIIRDDTDKGGRSTEETNEGMQNDDEVNGKEKNDSHLEAPRQTRTYHPCNKSFEERLDELQTFKAKHGHVRVTMKQDKSLGKFCRDMRSARRATGRRTMAITEDRVKALDELGFDWGGKKMTFDERLEELKAFKAKHGHVRVTMKQDTGLARFCKQIRCGRHGKGNSRRVVTEDRIKALDELGFDWGDKNKSFEERIEELKVFKAKHGHVRITPKQDKSLAVFCKYMRCARRGKGTGSAMTDNRIKALDDLGFEWALRTSAGYTE